MKCVNLDKEFRLYLQQWIKQNQKKYRNYDAMEEAMPEVYSDFLSQPLPLLGGVSPRAFFDGMTDAPALVRYMEDYVKQRVPVPDILLERIASLGAASEEPLLKILLKEKSPRETKLLSIDLLRRIDSVRPMDIYIAWQVSRDDGENDLADKALEALDAMGEKAVAAMRLAYDGATPGGKESLLGLLSKYPCDSALVQSALSLLISGEARVAVLADYLGRMGDDSIVDTLVGIAASEDTGYLDYIELRNAIERLGGVAPERDWDESDPEYNALRALQEKKNK